MGPLALASATSALFNSPGNMFTGPKWKAALYIDDEI
jgi:hypothetical protein